MKKTVIIAILIVYLASILAVNFFGLQMVVSAPTVYVDQIVMNGISLERTEGSLETFSVQDDDGLTSYRFYYENGKYSSDNVDENPNTVIIDYTILPEEANHKEVDIIIAVLLCGVGVFRLGLELHVRNHSNASGALVL